MTLRNDAVSFSSTIDTSIAHINASQKALFDAMGPMRSLRHEFDHLRKLIDTPTERIFREPSTGWMNSIREQQQRWQEMTMPLEKLHASMSINKELAKALEGITHASKLQDEMNRLVLAQAKSFGDMTFPWDHLDHISKALAEQVALTQSSHLFNVAQSFDTSSLLGKNPYIAKSIQSLLEQSEWAKRFHVPVIDMPAAAAIAHLWGMEGVEKQLRGLGIDYQKLFDDLEMGEPAEVLERHLEPHGSKLSLSDILSLFSIILAVFVPIWQQYDSKQTEDRLEKAISQSEEAQSKRLEALEHLLKQILEENQSEERQAEFVVRSRSAAVRKSPQSGSKILAEVFPNQVVTLLAEKGKWVKVEYFDWIAQEYRYGWVLKKYLIRVPRARTHH